MTLVMNVSQRLQTLNSPSFSSCSFQILYHLQQIPGAAILHSKCENSQQAFIYLVLMPPGLQPYLLAFHMFIGLFKMAPHIFQIVASCKSLQNQPPACIYFPHFRQFCGFLNNTQFFQFVPVNKMQFLVFVLGSHAAS